MKIQVDNVVRIPCSLEKNFFTYWFLFLEPFHHLTKKEIEVLSTIVAKRFQLSKNISDETILDQFLFSEEVRREMRESLGMTVSHFQVMVSKFKKVGILDSNNKINPRFLPKITEENGNYKMLLLFDFSEK